MKDLPKCTACNLTRNLWLCLTCGSIGCGRQQFAGDPGNSHQLQHYNLSSHPISVKLGSLSADSDIGISSLISLLISDVYCYICGEERTDDNIHNHLLHFHIDPTQQNKTEKTLIERQIEENLKWDFSTTTDSGNQMQPVFGPGLTGLKNLGNSCYLASVVQCLFSLPAFQQRYYGPNLEPLVEMNPADSLESQLRKMADGLLSGRYSKKIDDHTDAQEGLPPTMFKTLVGRGHPEFATNKQQACYFSTFTKFRMLLNSSDIFST
ncbi:Ubiquitin carboxyl-terminal hydrolase 14 [Neolecta irregularis DAH-3]|uniref:Ubiquitin carboxyl-terminal hydrolase 14 n=1 Tax=Neolecta irregularis (strain DAH-3) TaxID=1198029 RepID=A0A1U7LJZ6_NEOID|nr:Ubiquitin carboxyl-terminal hydrolase 14 [Neolecta irregularis DAH-3]|eukprot:OLL22980.1 Ubiquitin carboxyl-terminal hydrolase 14 [Neolecta irregularis DAH-3]